MLFEWLRDRRKEQAQSETVSLKQFKIMILLIDILEIIFCSFFTIPCLEVYPPLAGLSASAVIMRFKKKTRHGATARKAPRPIK
jgi:hypothetical protein